MTQMFLFIVVNPYIELERSFFLICFKNQVFLCDTIIVLTGFPGLLLSLVSKMHLAILYLYFTLAPYTKIHF